MVRTDLGETNVHAVVGAYKFAASSGDSDADGSRHLKAVAGEMFAKTGPPAPASEDGMASFKQRLADPDVTFVVFEGQWGRWARDVALECGKNFLGLMPSYREPFRAAYCFEPLFNFDGEERIRNTKADIDNFHGWPEEDTSYIIANCLVGNATDSAGRRRFGAFLPCSDAVLQDQSLRDWLDGDTLPERDRVVTVISLGSQSALTTLSASVEADLVKGSLEASPRVLIASKALPDDPALKAFTDADKVRCMEYLPLWDVLNHANVQCFVSHCGANSAHEALLAGTAVVPLPFFDDQFYIAERLEELYGYAAASGDDYRPLRKAELRRGGPDAVTHVASAVRLGLAAPNNIVQSLQQEALQEDGVGKAAEAIASKINL